GQQDQVAVFRGTQGNGRAALAAPQAQAVSHEEAAGARGGRGEQGRVFAAGDDVKERAGQQRRARRGKERLRRAGGEEEVAPFQAEPGDRPRVPAEREPAARGRVVVEVEFVQHRGGPRNAQDAGRAAGEQGRDVADLCPPQTVVGGDPDLFRQFGRR